MQGQVSEERRTTTFAALRAIRAAWLAEAVLALALGAAACGPETIPNPNKKRDGGIGSGGNESGRDGGSGTTAGDGGRGGNASQGGRSGAGAGGSIAGSDAAGSTAGSGQGGSSGSVAGSSGTSGSPDCTSDEECAVDQPQCNADGSCGACTSDEACEGREGKPRCSLGLGAFQGQCVLCVEPSDCADAATPYCLERACVECTTHAQCTDPSKPQCNAGVCGGCTGDSACEGRAEGTHCVTAAGDASLGQCVGCTEHGHCENPTPECGADHACKTCASNDACNGRAATPVCDLSSDAAFAGKCVGCTGTEYASCGSAPGGTPFVCDSLARTCTTEIKASALACEACVSDAQCATGRVCMRTKFGAAETGSYCLWTQDAAGPGAPNGNCGAVRPFIIGENAWQSVDGATPTVCKPAVTTCQAQNEFRGTSCTGPTPEGHAQCGAEGVADAYCAPFLTGHRCTVPCVSYDDCQDTRPGDDMECKPQTLGAVDVKVCQFQ